MAEEREGGSEYVLIFVTRYAVTRGIEPVWVLRSGFSATWNGKERVQVPRKMRSRLSGWRASLCRPDWHPTYAEALQDARQRVQRELASLKRKEARLQALTFPDLAPSVPGPPDGET